MPLLNSSKTDSLASEILTVHWLEIGKKTLKLAS
jgi:hypothetical protein